jgi:hypothetical protein
MGDNLKKKRHFRNFLLGHRQLTMWRVVLFAQVGSAVIHHNS